MSAKDIWTAKMTYKRKSLEDTFKRFFISRDYQEVLLIE